MTMINLEDTVERTCGECDALMDVPRALAEGVYRVSSFICTECDKTPDFCYDCGTTYDGVTHRCSDDTYTGTITTCQGCGAYSDKFETHFRNGEECGQFG